MLLHYIKTFFRSFRKNRIYTITGVLSLSLGLAFCITVFVYLWTVTKPPTFHTHYGNIFQVEATTAGDQRVRHFPQELIPYLKEQVPEVRYVTTYESGYDWISANEKTLHERVIFADPSFFDVFSFKASKGNPAAIMASTDQALVSESLARKLFGSDAALGKKVTIYGAQSAAEFTISGILQPYPYSSVLKPEVILPISYLDQVQNCSVEKSIDCEREITVVTNDPGTSTSGLAKRLSGQNTSLSSMLGKYGDEAFASFGIQPVFKKPGLFNTATIIIFLLCLAVLILSCVNYINNTIAVASTRIKEIGIRKVFGIRKSGITIQFMVEALLTTLLAFFLGLFLIELSRPFINDFVQMNFAKGTLFTLAPLAEPGVIMYVGLILMVTALLAGIYPALYIAGFNPSLILNNKSKMGSTPAFSKFLVGFQLMFGLILMVLVLNIQQTTSDSDSRHYGVSTGDTWMINVNEQGQTASGGPNSGYERFRNQALKSAVPVEVGGLRGRIINVPRVSVQKDNREYQARIFRVDPFFFRTLNMPFLSGDGDPRLNNPVQRDSSYAIINRVMANQMNIGTDMSTETLLTIDGRDLRVIGVVDKFTGLQAQKSESPVLFMLTPPGSIDYAIINLSRASAPQKLLNEDVKQWWSTAGVSSQLYTPITVPDPAADFKLMIKLAGIIAGVALLFTFIGLFSLANFSVSRRLKEISIRKVNGATPRQIIQLLTGDYLKIGIAAFILALPLGYIASNQVLKMYINQGGQFLLLFLYSSVCLLAFVLSCVAYQVYQASNVNPVKYLKDE